MPLFRRPKAAETAPPAPAPTPAPVSIPPVDDLAGDADAHWFRDELAAGRWHEFHDFLDRTRDSNLRNFYVSGLASLKDRPGWLDDWVAARPDSPLPLLFRGTHSTLWAWEARGAGRATTVAEDSWAVFHNRLISGDRDLARAAAMDGRDPTPYARAIWTAIGLSLGQHEIRTRFAEVTRRDRWHKAAHTSMIQALAAKWYGSNEEMFSFARSVLEQAPEGHGVHRVIPHAHLEQWLNLPRESEDGKERQKEYFQARVVQDEINRAADLSIRSGRYADDSTSAGDRNPFAMCFWLMRDYEAQLEQMRLIGPRILSGPWQYQGDPARAYERARATATQKLAQAAAGQA